jgi:SHS family lactate transporter-like MFS transporter
MNRTSNPFSPADRNRAVVAGFLGWTLDAFDFALVPITSTAIANDLHVPNRWIILTITATLGARPLGAIVFGLMADRYGRRLPLMLNLVFYSIIEVLTGFAPNFTTFILLRFLFGIGMGGEWGVGASLMLEKVSPRYRGLLSGLLQEGYALGNLLAALAFAFLYPYFTSRFPQFHAWRILFLLGGLPALLALFVRYGIKESEVWRVTRSESWSQLFSVIGAHWRLLLYLIVLMSMFNLASHGTQDLYPTFLKADHGLEKSPTKVGIITAITQIGSIIGGLTVGFLSDKIGRRRAINLAFAGAVVCVPLWTFSPVGNLALLALGGFLIQFMVQGAWGVVPAHLAELAPDSVRGFLPGFGYQCGALIAGILPPLQETLAEYYPRRNIMAITCILVFLLGILVVWLGKERKGRIFGEVLFNAAQPEAGP